MVKRRTKNPIKQWWKLITAKSIQLSSKDFFFSRCLDRRPADNKTTDTPWDLYTYCEYEEDTNGGYLFYRELFNTEKRRPNGALIEYVLYEV